PAVVDLVDGYGVQEVELLAAAPRRADEVRFLEQRQVLGHRLAAHLHPFAELAECEPTRLVKPVEQLPPARIREGLEHRIHPFTLLPLIMQVITCMSRLKKSAIRRAAPPARAGRSAQLGAGWGARDAMPSAWRSAVSDGR